MSNGKSYDAIVIGAGHNGLVTAAYLARAGLRAVVLESAEEVGGAAVSREFHPGFRAPALAHLLPEFDRRAVRDLRLQRHGLPSGQPAVASVALRPDRGALVLDADPRRAAEAIREVSLGDAARWPAFHKRMRGHVAALRPLLEGTPPRLDFSERGNLITLGRLGWSMRRRGRAEMRDLLRIIAMNAADLVEDTFDTNELKGALALDAVLGTHHGPRSPNTVFTLLHRWAGAGNGGWTLPTGGPAQMVDALAVAARATGAEIQTGARVARVNVAAGEVRGVELHDGSVIDAPIVASSADPVTTFSDLVGPDHLDADFLNDVHAIRSRGSTGKVNFALERAPDLPTPTGGPARWLLAHSVDYVETAFDHAKYGESPSEPALEITVPSLTEPGFAPSGQHVMSVNVAFAPYDADSGNLIRSVTALIERYAPGFSEAVLAAEAFGPHEGERQFGNRGGDWHHGDIALDQFFMVRPVPGFARYRAPVEGLYLCGAGAHPGGGLTGTNGTNAAREILADRKRGRRAA